MKKNPSPSYAFLPLVSENNPEGNYIVRNVTMHMQKMGARILTERSYQEPKDKHGVNSFCTNLAAQYDKKTLFIYAGKQGVNTLKDLPSEQSIAIINDKPVEEMLFEKNPLIRNGGQWKAWRNDTLGYTLQIGFAVVTKENMQGMKPGAFEDPHFSIVDYMPADEVIAKSDAVIDKSPILSVSLPKETRDILGDLKTQKDLAIRIAEACVEKDYQIVLVENGESKDHSMTIGMMQALDSLVENRIEVVKAEEKPNAHRLPALLLQHCPGHKKADILEAGKEIYSRVLVVPPESGKVIAYNILGRYAG